MNVFNKLICKLKSIYFTLNFTEGKGRIIFKDANLQLKILKRKNAKIILNGNLILTDFFGDNSIISIKINSGGKFIIEDDFEIGSGVKIIVSNDALLKIEGKGDFNLCGITGNSIIMAKDKIEIGKDFICSWNVFISDSDWHGIENVQMTIPVKIGNSVWIANNCNILKGSILGSGSIVGSNTKTINKIYNDNSLILGEKGNLIKENVKWCK